MQDQDKINRNVNALSTKLLEGCKLLSESCPETNVPLVLTKDGRMFSVGNETYYRKENGKLVPDGGSSSVVATSAAGAPQPRPAADDQTLSAHVAQKLLEGWTLLPDTCPETNVPLVQSKDGQILSVGTGKHHRREPSGALREVAAPAPLLAVGNGAPTRTSYDGDHALATAYPPPSRTVTAPLSGGRAAVVANALVHSAREPSASANRG